jgi:hypothetical protein
MEAKHRSSKDSHLFCKSDTETLVTGDIKDGISRSRRGAMRKQSRDVGDESGTRNLNA